VARSAGGGAIRYRARHGGEAEQRELRSRGRQVQIDNRCNSATTAKITAAIGANVFSVIAQPPSWRKRRDLSSSAVSPASKLEAPNLVFKRMRAHSALIEEVIFQLRWHCFCDTDKFHHGIAVRTNRAIDARIFGFDHHRLPPLQVACGIRNAGNGQNQSPDL